jgi:hypothetical protein
MKGLEEDVELLVPIFIDNLLPRLLRKEEEVKR